MLIAYLPTSGIQNTDNLYQNSLDFTKFPLTKVSNLVYVILGCKNGVLEYQGEMEKC